MTGTAPAQSLRLSNMSTKFTKFFAPVFTALVAVMIAVETHYAVWALAIAMTLVVLIAAFSWTLADAYLDDGQLRFAGLFGAGARVELREVSAIKKISSGRHHYFYFSTTKGNFLVVAPVWGEGRKALLDLYEDRRSGIGAPRSHL